jgi:hypothetical protein
MKKVGVNAYVTYNKTIKKYVVSARDFVFNYLCNEEEDGSMYFVTSSDNTDYNMPEQSGVIRAYTALSGIMLKPDPVDPENKCIMSSCVEIDLKGGIPDFILKTALKDQGYQVKLLRNVIPKWKKMFPGDTPTKV